MAVGVDTAVLLLCRGDLSQIVQKSQQHEAVRLRNCAAEGCGTVGDLHGVGPDVAFGMVDGILGKTDKGFKLREPDAQLVHAAQDFEKD